jgi:hypothetical protein
MLNTTPTQEANMNHYTTYETAYYGIYKQHEEGQWFLCEARYGTAQAFDHEPSEAEVKAYRNHLVSQPEFA